VWPLRASQLRKLPGDSGNNGDVAAEDSMAAGPMKDSITQASARHPRTMPMIRTFMSVSEAIFKGFTPDISKSQQTTTILLEDHKERDEDWLLNAVDLLAVESNATVFLNLRGVFLRNRLLSKRLPN
jgi:hypothetical protein